MEIKVANEKLRPMGREAQENPFLEEVLTVGETYEVSYEGYTRTQVETWLAEWAHSLGYRLRKEANIPKKTIRFMMYGDYKYVPKTFTPKKKK